MIKADLINKISKELNIPKQEAENGVNLFFDTIKDAILKGEEIEVRGFGSFRFRSRPPRSGPQPADGRPGQGPAQEGPVLQAEQAAQRADQQVMRYITAPWRETYVRSVDKKRRRLRLLPRRWRAGDDRRPASSTGGAGLRHPEQVSLPVGPPDDRPRPAPGRVRAGARP